jgi:YqaJ-like viral recombinase domain
MNINDLPILQDCLHEIKSVEELTFFNEEESLELYDTCLHIMEEYIKDNIKLMSEPDFDDEFDENVEELMHSHFDYDIFYNEEAQEEMEEIIEKARTDFFGSLYVPRSYSKSLILTEPNYEFIKTHLEYLSSKPQPEQRTKEWYQFRYNLITASNAWKVFENQTIQNQLIYEKCQPLNQNNIQNENENDDNNVEDETVKIIDTSSNVKPTNTVVNVNVNSTLHWGQKYEPLSVKIYEYVYNTKIGDFGCIQHDKYSFLGASPDGINIDPESKRYGRMLEIKNIVNREIDGIPKKEYWIQMQLQMEVCDLDECDFLETKFIEYVDEQEFLNDTLDEPSYTEDDEEEFIDLYVSKERKMKGIILYFHTKEGKPLYIYKPLELVHPEDVTQWIEENVDTYTGNKYNHMFMKTLYWKLQHISCVLVCRNKEWFRHSINDIADLWAIVERERSTGYEHRAPNKRVKKEGNIMDLKTTDVSLAPVSSCLLKFNKDTGKITVVKSDSV